MNLNPAGKNSADDERAVGNSNTRELAEVNAIPVSRPLRPVNGLEVRAQVGVQDGVDVGDVRSVKHELFLCGNSVEEEITFSVEEVLLKPEIESITSSHKTSQKIISE